MHHRFMEQELKHLEVAIFIELQLLITVPRLLLLNHGFCTGELTAKADAGDPLPLRNYLRACDVKHLRVGGKTGTASVLQVKFFFSNF